VSGLTNGALERLNRAVADIETLRKEKADSKDVQRLADEFESLRHTLQWFMGITAGAVMTFAGLVIALIQGG
jgi:hypothetical protein